MKKLKFTPGIGKVLIENFNADTTASGIIVDKSLTDPGDENYGVVRAIGPMLQDGDLLKLKEGDKVITHSVGKTVQLEGNCYELLHLHQIDGVLKD